MADGQLDDYRREHPEVMNYISLHARVYVPTDPKLRTLNPTSPDFKTSKHLPWARSTGETSAPFSSQKSFRG
jgi:hypothetical protein